MEKLEPTIEDLYTMIKSQDLELRERDRIIHRLTNKGLEAKEIVENLLDDPNDFDLKEYAIAFLKSIDRYSLDDIAAGKCGEEIAYKVEKGLI